MNDGNKTLHVEELTQEAFKPFGTFAPMTPPLVDPLADDGIITFWPDVAILGIVGSAINLVGAGICRTRWRPLVIDTAEYHADTQEGIQPLDGDIFLHVGAPTRNGELPEEWHVFRVPQDTIVVLNENVWHHAPFTAEEGAVVHSQILLPPKTYKNDCAVTIIVPPVPFEL